MDDHSSRVVCPRCRELEEQVRALTAALEEARRAAGKRQAAPFRKGKTVAHPKRPGRKAGEDYGKHSRREPPVDAPVDEKYDASLPLTCPHCHSGNLEPSDGVEEQFQTEIECRTLRRQFVLHRGRCRDCGKAVVGRHPLQTSTATGAACEQLGPRAHTLMSVLNKRLGLSHGKVRWLFEKVFALKTARSTSASSVLRAAGRLEAAYQQVRNDVRVAEEVTPDETGWRVGGGKAWLHAFATAQTVCYEIDPTRSGDVAERLLGIDWQGRLVHDGWSVYQRFASAVHQQCNAHLLNRCKELLEVARRGAARLPRAIQAILQKGLATRDRFEQRAISPHGLQVAAGRLTAALGRVVDGAFTDRRQSSVGTLSLRSLAGSLHVPASSGHGGHQLPRRTIAPTGRGQSQSLGRHPNLVGCAAQSVLMSPPHRHSLLRGIDP